jgi:hypothetical protein
MDYGTCLSRIGPVCNAFQAVRDSIKKANQDDYQNMLNQLHITSIRTHVTNYDERKPTHTRTFRSLTLKNGKKVTTPDVWISAA